MKFPWSPRRCKIAENIRATQRFKFCQNHSCTYPSCNKKTLSTKPDTAPRVGALPVQHHTLTAGPNTDTCHNTGCNYIVAPYHPKPSKYCFLHKCGYCQRPAFVDGSFCDKHKCAVNACTLERIGSASYCVLHKCQRPDCYAKARAPSEHCQVNQHRPHRRAFVEVEG
jgi:hypothetical protein